MLNPIQIAVFFLFMIVSKQAQAHLALDHLKQNLEKRHSEVESSTTLNQQNKENALCQLRILKSKYATAASLSAIPSQQKAAERMASQLDIDLQNFDQTLQNYKSEGESKK